jgi:glutamate--cysteine ligase
LLESVLNRSGLPFRRGIEKEGLRTDREFTISQHAHPAALGHPLTHPGITTDYSEALLELITSVHSERDGLIGELRDVHTFVHTHLGDELLWAGSMPCRLAGEQSIRIAEYGDSNIGRLKHVYRQGLGVRYGRIMQSIAGMHFNFSLSEILWQHWADQEGVSDVQSFKSQRYFALIRNFRRRAWLLMYLFGASPALDRSFLERDGHGLQPLNGSDTWHLPYATSLRMGDLGYHNNAQASLAICFNTLGSFVATLREAMRTPWPPYVKTGLTRDGQYIQLNTSILQIENEYYSSIRPKRTIGYGEHPCDALAAQGVEYIEVRCLDLNPFYDIGTCDTDIDFMDLFLTHCLTEPSPFIADSECEEVARNFTLTVNRGRQPGLLLSRHEQDITLQQWANDVLNGMDELATVLDGSTGDHRYRRSLDRQRDKIVNPNLTPSGHLLQVMQTERLSWLDCAGALSQKHQLTLRQRTLHPSFTATKEHLRQLADESFVQANALHRQDDMSFEHFLDAYMNRS